jgi:hypothetical protein
LEDSYLDGDLGKDRYLIRRDQILAELAEIQEGLATRLQPAMPDLDELFAIADTITVENLDDEAWRDIIEGMVEKVVIEGTGKQSLAAIKVHWKPAFESLIDLTGC